MHPAIDAAAWLIPWTVTAVTFCVMAAFTIPNISLPLNRNTE